MNRMRKSCAVSVFCFLLLLILLSAMVVESRPRHDCLKWIKFLCSDIFQPKPIRYLIYAMFTVNFAALVIHIVYFVHMFNMEVVLDYFSSFSYIVFGSVIWSAFILKGTIVANLKDQYQLWSIDSADRTAKLQIEQEALVSLIYACVTYAKFITIGLIVGFVDHGDVFPLLLVNLMTEHSVPSPFIWAYKLTFAVTLCVLGAHSCQVIYATQHAKFQMYLLKSCISYISPHDESPQDLVAFYDRKYQHEVREKLVFCVKRHQFLIIAFLNKIAEMSDFIVWFALGGTTTGLGCITLLYKSYQSNNYLLVSGMVLAFSVQLCGFVIYGQLAENESENFRLHLILLPKWYSWDDGNKRILLNCIPMTQKPIQIKFTQRVAINHELGMMILKGIFSAGNVLAQIKLREMRNHSTTKITGWEYDPPPSIEYKYILKQINPAQSWWKRGTHRLYKDGDLKVVEP